MKTTNISGVECICYALTALTATQLRDALSRATGQPVLRQNFRATLDEAKALGFVWAVNPGDKILLLKEA